MAKSRPFRVLYLEDDVEAARGLRLLLERAGYLVDVAGNGREGLALYRQNPYDIILVNQNLAGAEGLETIRLLAGPGPLPPTVVVTGPGNRKVAVQAANLGIAGDEVVKAAAGNSLESLAAVVEAVLKPSRPAVPKSKPRLPAAPGQASIERAKQEWESTVDSLSQLVCLLDEQRRILRANRTVERWGLAPVAGVKGRDLHHLFHPDCTAPDCRLEQQLAHAWQVVGLGQPAEFAGQDWLPGRYFEVQVRPISAETLWQDKVEASFAVVVIQDITERRQSEEEREKLIEELDAFAHTVAHDLKNPLFRISGYTEVLKNEYTTLPGQQVNEFFQVITRNVRKMSNIVDELLLLSSVRVQEIELSPLDMAGLVAEAQQRLLEVIQETEAEIILPDAWPEAMGYGPWVEEVWVNYLSNAIRYGGRPPKVVLDAFEQPDGMVCFSVTDNGDGLSPEEQARLFKPFIQLKQVRTEGYGLGLSIARRIVEKLGGQVKVFSEGAPGKGCTFSFTLPGKPAA